jgi:GntR family transcriptional repressor for pyruvate dehydrogenase complex
VKDKDLLREGSTNQVVEFVRGLIGKRELRPGSRLPAERDLAVQIGVSRPTARAGLRALAAMGIVKTRHGAGTFISETPMLESEPLSFLAALHGFTREEMFEARRILEVSAAGLAAERATPEQLAAISGEVRCEYIMKWFP